LSEIDLTPRDIEPVSRQRGLKSPKNWLIGSIFVGLVGFLMYQALNSARVFFLNVDEAVAQKSDLGDQNFRMQGIVLTEANPDSSNYVFVMGFEQVQAAVSHVGDEPSDLFECGQNVVVEGRWLDSGLFESKQILVKHSEEYREDYPDRTDAPASSCIGSDELDESITSSTNKLL